MSDRRQQLYDAVLDDPDALEPRLAMAAWLDEQGDPQGEFIRLQIEADGLRRAGNPPRTSFEQRERAKQILAQHKAEWSRAVEALATQPRFYRGFIEGVTMDAQQFLSRGAELYRLAPVRSLSLSNTRDLVGDIAASPLLERLASLQFGKDRLGNEHVRLIAASTHLGRLKRLELSFNEIGMPGLEALCATDRLPSLLHVNLAGNRVEEPQETFGEDGMSGLLVRESISLPELGKELEARYGYKAWFHEPSLYVNFPLFEDDV